MPAPPEQSLLKGKVLCSQIAEDRDGDGLSRVHCADTTFFFFSSGDLHLIALLSGSLFAV